MDVDLESVVFGSGSLAVVAACLYGAYRILNHHRLISRCCGHVGEVSIDVEPTTPPYARR